MVAGLSDVFDNDDIEEEADKDRLCVLLDLVDPGLNAGCFTPSKVCSPGPDPTLALFPDGVVGQLLSVLWNS